MGKWIQFPMSNKECPIMKKKKRREDKTKLSLLLQEIDELISIIFINKETAKKINA